MFNIRLNKNMADFQWSFLSIITASMVQLLLRIMLSKDLGPSGLGVYTLVFTIYMFGMQFAAFGINSSLTQYIAQYRDNLPKIKEYVSLGILGSIVSGSVMSLTLFLFSNVISTQFFHNPAMVTLLKYTALCFPFLSMQKVVIGTLNGLREMKWYAIVNITQNVLVILITIFLVKSLGMDTRGAVLGFVISTILVGLISLLLIRNYFTVTPNIENKILKEILLFGFYVVLANSIGIINTQIDSLLIGHFMNELDVGYYAIAIIFIQGITLIPDSIQRVTTPLMAAYYGKRDFESIRHLIKETMIKILLITVFIDLLMIVFGETLIGIIFTKEFIPAYPPLLILLIGYSIYAPYVAIGTCLTSIGKVQIIFRISAISAGLNTILNIMLISTFGLVGAACATSTSLLFTTLISLYLVRKYTSENVLKSPAISVTNIT
jgi:O-antigen/teichoic acid export membrane protein